MRRVLSPSSKVIPVIADRIGTSITVPTGWLRAGSETKPPRTVERAKAWLSRQLPMRLRPWAQKDMRFKRGTCS